MNKAWKEDEERGSRKLIDIMHWIILHLGRPVCSSSFYILLLPIIF